MAGSEIHQKFFTWSKTKKLRKTYTETPRICSDPRRRAVKIVNISAQLGN
jgi:hypothetical protein